MDLHKTSAELENDWQASNDSGEWPEEDDVVSGSFMDAVASVNTIVSYRDNCRVGHLGT
jgi:hypothetical protein